jgi:hypothetical protein
VQKDEELEEENSPAGQAIQDPAPALEKNPAEQVMQLELPLE